jgi:hypothetical protein
VLGREGFERGERGLVLVQLKALLDELRLRGVEFLLRHREAGLEVRD